MVGSRFWVSQLGFALVLLILVVLWGPVVSAANTNAETAARCKVDLSTFIPLPYRDTSNMVCKSLWNTYVLQYSQSKDNLVNIVLSAVYTTGWVSIAYSKNGMMRNSSAMVGWVSKEGQANIKQYYLKGVQQSDVVPDKGDLPLTKVPAFVALRGATIYIAFQLKFAAPLAHQPILLAFGSKYPTKDNLLYLHDDQTTVVFDFSTGSVSVAPGEFGHMKRNHGLLGLIGWGLFLPYGAIAARYLKYHDILWYYLHVGIQFLGVILGLGAIVTGMSLYSKIDAHFPLHKGIGIFILLLSILQILALFIRPEKDSKIRRYWNCYHIWVGRIALFLGNVNIALGIKIGDAGGRWKAGYGFLLCTVLIATVFVEVLLRKRREEEEVDVFQLD